MAIQKKDLREGDPILVSKHIGWRFRDLFAWRIQATTHSKWNHAGLIVRKNGIWMIAEACFNGGVVLSPLDKYMTDQYDFSLMRPILANEYQGRIAARFAMSKVGCGYEYAKIIRIRLLQLILGHETADTIDARDNDNVFICSELVIRSWRAAGIKLGGAFSGPSEVAKHVDPYFSWTGA